MSENAHDTNKYKDYRKWEKRPLKFLLCLLKKLLRNWKPCRSACLKAVCSELRKHCNDLLKRAEDRVRELDQKFGNQQDDDEPEETPVSRRSRRNDDDIPF